MSELKLTADQSVNMAALRAAVDLGGKDLEKTLRAAAYIRDWINGSDVHDLDIPDDLI